MFSQLHLLIIDDSEDDALLIKRALEKEGFKISSHRVENAKELAAALDTDSWDIILSDYSMPGFNGADALELCREKAFDAPFVIVSGRIGEEVAVEMLKAGAAAPGPGDNARVARGSGAENPPAGTACHGAPGVDRRDLR